MPEKFSEWEEGTTNAFATASIDSIIYIYIYVVIFEQILRQYGTSRCMVASLQVERSNGPGGGASSMK